MFITLALAVLNRDIEWIISAMAAQIEY